MALINCPECSKQVSDNALSCPHCGNQLSTGISCPNCRSKEVNKISGASKVGSALMFGVLAMGKLSKTYECKDCKYKW